MARKRSLTIALILTAAAGAIALQKWVAPKGEFVPPTSPATSTFEPASPAEQPDAPTFEGCAFVWAYREAPQLTEEINRAVGIINPQASANASLFGEDCIYQDGHSTFSVMETDFYVRLPVEDLGAEEEFGDWMSAVLQAVAQIPREEMQGNYGFVEFWFIRNETEQVIVKVPLGQYFNEARGLSGVELFRMFYEAPVSPAPT